MFRSDIFSNHRLNKHVVTTRFGTDIRKLKQINNHPDAFSKKQTDINIRHGQQFVRKGHTLYK
jgi:hypothetical protein